MASEEIRAVIGMMRLELRETTANTSGLSHDSTYKRAFELTAPVTTECPLLPSPRAQGQRDDAVPCVEGKLGKTITRQRGI